MFDNLSERLTQTMQKLRGKGRLTEDSIRETLREVRIALLEADVALPVVQSFISHVRERALGQEVISSLPWRRSMRWAAGAPIFARPIRWLLASMGGEVVPFSMGPVQSGLTSMGHRFTADPGPFEATTLLSRVRQVLDPA